MSGPGSVVVTGAASGIGAAIARHLAGNGWQVTCVDRDAPADAAHFAAVYQADLSDIAATEQIARELAGASALVHAAGLMRTAPLAQARPSDGDLMWAVHVRALGILIGALAPAMGRGGRIVAVGSRTSRGAANKSQYAATKAAVVGLIRSVAAELAPEGITANIVAPAATATPMLTSAERGAVAPHMPPIGRFIEPDEIAATVGFLLSQPAAAITGQEIIICGGASL